jgi:flagellar motor protein MotB
VAAVLAIGILAAWAAGCKEQQLTEDNVALRRQLEKALADGAEMQGRLDALENQNQALQAEADKAKTAPGQPVTPGTGAAKPAKTKPEFGEGVEVKMAGEMMTVTLPDEVLFPSGSADLKANSKRILDKVAAALNGEYKAYNIRVEGHTDNQPIRKTKDKWKDNWDLACNRSMAVVRYLIQKGVTPERVYAAGFSYYRPVASNTSAPGQAKNRRVEIVVWPRK